MIDYQDFVARYYPSANNARQDDITRFLDNLVEIIGDTPLANALRNTQVLCSAFYLQKIGNNISRPHYQKIKEYLINLFDFVGVDATVPTREEVLASQETICYFRGINELLEFIDKVGSLALTNYNPTADLVRVKSICVLGWLGFTPDEIANIKVRDLSPIDISGYKVSNKNGTYEVYGQLFAALYYLSGLEEYNGLPSGRRVILKGNDEYLFRPTDANCEKLDGGQIIQIIKRFNHCIPRSIKTSIVFRNLHKNALFLEVYNDATDKSLINKIASIMGCTPNYAFNYRDQYLKFVEALESNKI
ncbi:hypothetical protein [uncultured Duncaniella sp.]|uniref:hypothetical protein n=1 Tax=uncultured Duncaniella sp. TaxID=2768039 RepID=UPI0026DEE3E8|nr:hypothetical protein [uncultured Duncaniella sp.]